MSETNEQFNAAHEQEMAEFFETDAMATPAEIDQSEKPPVKAADFSSKTQYSGVFVNRPNSRSGKKYRVAIAQQANRDSGTFWMNLGNFDCVHTAANCYNTHALGIFLGKAKLNRVSLADCDPVELAQFKKDRALRIAIAGLVIKSVTSAGEQLVFRD